MQNFVFGLCIVQFVTDLSNSATLTIYIIHNELCNMDRKMIHVHMNSTHVMCSTTPLVCYDWYYFLHTCDEWKRINSTCYVYNNILVVSSCTNEMWTVGKMALAMVNIFSRKEMSSPNNAPCSVRQGASDHSKSRQRHFMYPQNTCVQFLHTEFCEELPFCNLHQVEETPLFFSTYCSQWILRGAPGLWDLLQTVLL